MSKIYNISIILSFIGLWLTSFVSGRLEIILGFILIFSFGILHGSNDILLINSLSASKQKNTFSRVLSRYLITVCIAIAVFYFFPLFALIVFVMFSAFHFGEQHWEYRNLKITTWLSNSFFFIYGMLILNILFVLNPQEVIEVVYSITNYSINIFFIQYLFLANIVIFASMSIYLLLTSKYYKSLFLTELFYLVVFSIIFKVSTLIWGFTIYFIFWHSIPSLFEQVSFVYNDFNKKTVLKYCMKAFPYWLISILGIVVVYFIFKEDTIFYGIFFSFIAAVTFPHAIVINKMFSNKKTQSNT